MPAPIRPDPSAPVPTRWSAVRGRFAGLAAFGERLKAAPWFQSLTHPAFSPFHWKLPLAAKILLCFFANFVVLAVVFLLLFSTQSRLDLNWMFSSHQRVTTMCKLFIAELNGTPPDDWGEVVERFSDAYGIHFSLFEPNGDYLIGRVTRLPQEVKERLLLFASARHIQAARNALAPQFADPKASAPNTQNAQRSPAGAAIKPQGQADAPKGSPVAAAQGKAQSNTDSPQGNADPVRGSADTPRPPAFSQHGRAFFRTSSPPRYWLLQRARIENPRVGVPMRVFLVAEAESFSMGGLILDPVPWFGLIVGAVLFSVVCWLPLLHGMTRAIGQMTQTTRQIAEGRFDVRVATRRQDELGSLGESINLLAARLNGFILGQKRFLGDIAHELCSPLARLQMVLGIMEQRAGSDDQEGLNNPGSPAEPPCQKGQNDQLIYTRRAIEKAEQMARLVNELLTFSRATFAAYDTGASAVQLAPVPLLAVVELAAQREEVEGVCIRFDEISPDLLVLADAELLGKAVANLLRNAIRYGGHSAQIEVKAQREEEEILLTVADNGPGVPEEELPKLFDAFYRTDRARTRETGGMGLGLTIVKACVESCRGTVMARNRVPRGLEVEIRLLAGED